MRKVSTQGLPWLLTTSKQSSRQIRLANAHALASIAPTSARTGKHQMKPRYAELAQQMIREIGAGKFAIGTALPSELELSAQYGVSRSTVRSALQVVQDLGLISRRKRAGIRVE